MKYLYDVTYSFTDGHNFKSTGFASFLLDYKLDNMSKIEKSHLSIRDKLLQEYDKMHRWKITPDLSITYSDFKLLSEEN